MLCVLTSNSIAKPSPDTSKHQWHPDRQSPQDPDFPSRNRATSKSISAIEELYDRERVALIRKNFCLGSTTRHGQLRGSASFSGPEPDASSERMNSIISMIENEIWQIPDKEPNSSSGGQQVSSGICTVPLYPRKSRYSEVERKRNREASPQSSGMKRRFQAYSKRANQFVQRGLIGSVLHMNGIAPGLILGIILLIFLA
ncbi:uncharacterized protein LOC131879787 [Tigriopus californicus]|uniref:uncharacterized protein LOC131879787 n=1 Tax=Tigriopus californicus TaxID=6832 RepID=UPI0027DA4A7A|nr:uncharacterized protein LOC131879787 [Tigriopus californicus]|eukprot:TCALIF_09812-PA protein Name:"Protein of unknown function" AED:0.08 eAED:0.08 QI:64/1/0.66/1/0.5/0.66/3/0/199